jgi:L-glutamine-phosphate cytidylyltransferase
MKAIILCAGQGRRLLPYTESSPKCLLSLNDKYFIEWQIDALQEIGVEQIVAVVGYAAQRIETILGKRYGNKVSFIYNPFYEIADNLASCWMAREHFKDDFIILNGDTLFEPAVISTLLNANEFPITLAIDKKDSYDDDDMKVITDGARLLSVGKKLAKSEVNGESIGAMHFNPEGAKLFKDTIEELMYSPESLQKWYLSIIDQLASQQHVGTCSIHGLEWTEVDFVQDLDRAQQLAEKWSRR